MTHPPARQFERLPLPTESSVALMLDGHPIRACAGDTVLTAILVSRRHVRQFDFSAEPRGGFCLMGACQDCWVALETGERIRACSTYVEAEMRIVSTPRTPNAAGLAP